MKKLTICIFLLFSGSSYAQLIVMEKVNREICDSLKRSPKPLDDFTQEDINEVFKTCVEKHFQDWHMEREDYKRTNLLYNTDHAQFAAHLLLMNCKEYRTIDMRTDPFLKGGYLRPHFLKTKEFIYALQDDEDYQHLKRYLNDSLWSTRTGDLLDSAKTGLKRCKSVSIRTIDLNFGDKFTFKLNYHNYLTYAPEYQIEVIFDNKFDLSIDGINIKGQDELFLEIRKNRDSLNGGSIFHPPPKDK